MTTKQYLGLGATEAVAEYRDTLPHSERPNNGIAAKPSRTTMVTVACEGGAA